MSKRTTKADLVRQAAVLRAELAKAEDGNANLCMDLAIARAGISDANIARGRVEGLLGTKEAELQKTKQALDGAHSLVGDLRRCEKAHLLAAAHYLTHEVLPRLTALAATARIDADVDDLACICDGGDLKDEDRDHEPWCPAMYNSVSEKARGAAAIGVGAGAATAVGAKDAPRP